jgi:hypothetical protein
MAKIARGHILSLRLSDEEHEQLMALLNSRPYASVSDAIRQMLVQHVAEPPPCHALKPGTWTGSYLPVCMLPARHWPLLHWWRHEPTGQVQTWNDDASLTIGGPGPAETDKAGPND